MTVLRNHVALIQLWTNLFSFNSLSTVTRKWRQTFLSLYFFVLWLVRFPWCINRDSLELETAVTFAGAARSKLCHNAAPSRASCGSCIKRFHFSFIVILRQSKLTELQFISMDTPSNRKLNVMTHIFEPNSSFPYKPLAEIKRFRCTRLVFRKLHMTKDNFARKSCFSLLQLKIKDVSYWTPS